MSLLEEVRGNKTLSRAGREIAHAGRNVWLAGLGAVAEVGEGGRKLFGQLVEKGRPVAALRRKQVESLVAETGKKAKDLGQLAQDQAVYEGKRVLKALKVPTRQDVRALASRIDALTSKLAEIEDNHPVAEGEAPTPRQRRTAKR
jgi:poly(hydroxyalkanoate) granule-associated protein